MRLQASVGTCDFSDNLLPSLGICPCPFLPHLLPPAAMVCRSIFSPVILSPIFHAVCTPHPPANSPPPALAGCLIHVFVCSPQVYPRKSAPAVDRLCVGVPAAEVSQNAAELRGVFSDIVFSCLFFVL